MKAVVYQKYGPPDVLEVTEMERPTPKENEVLVRTVATTVTSGDWRARSLDLPAGFGLIGRLIFGIFEPRQPILGSELAGVVEAVGSNVRQFHVGERVFVFTGANLGCYAEYICVAENGNIVSAPDCLNFHEAAALSFGGTTSLDFFRKGKVKSGENVLINGASGGVGTAAVQIAKHLGANVTGVCGTRNLELVKSLGADQVIDYTCEDFTQSGHRYDVIMDTVGTAPFTRCQHSLGDDGRLLIVLGGMIDLLRIPVVSITTSKRIVGGAAAELVEDLRCLAELAQLGKFKPVIDRVYPVAEIVDAHKYVDSGRKTGNVIISWE